MKTVDLDRSHHGVSVTTQIVAYIDHTYDPEFKCQVKGQKGESIVNDLVTQAT
jgi:hypothetical protein